MPPPPEEGSGVVPTVDAQEDAISTGDDDESMVYIVFLLIPPIFFALYVMLTYRYVEFKYLSWRFSHTNPFIVFGYMPQERRDALWKEIQLGKGKPPSSTVTIKRELASTDDTVAEKTDKPLAGASSAPETI